MSEQQFWESNPRIIKVWEKCYREEQNRKNQFVHMIFGTYGMSAFTTAISQVMQPILCDGKRSKATYMDEPVRIFPMTEEEKEAEKQRMTDAFIAWGNAVEAHFKKQSPNND